MNSPDIIPIENDLLARRHYPAMALLQSFEAVARLESVTRAASELSLTQSAVSRQIKALEDLTGQALFFREKQRIRLTPVGATYATEIRHGLVVISTATLECRANAQGGVLNLAVLPTFAARWLAPRLAGFSVAHPGITLNLATRFAPFDFDLDRIDVAIHFGTPEWPGAELAHLMPEDVLPVSSLAFRAEYAPIRPEDLMRVPLIALSSRPHAWSDWFALHGQHLRARPTIVIDQFATAAQLAISGQGVALMPCFFVEDELARGNLVPAVDGPPIASKEAYHLAWPMRRRDYPPAMAFRNWILQEAGTNP